MYNWNLTIFFFNFGTGNVSDSGSIRRPVADGFVATGPITARRVPVVGRLPVADGRTAVAGLDVPRRTFWFLVLAPRLPVHAAVLNAPATRLGEILSALRGESQLKTGKHIGHIALQRRIAIKPTRNFENN